MYGMLLRGDAATYLLELLEPLPREEHKKWMEAVVDAIQKLPVASSMITKEIVYKAAKEVGEDENYNLDNILEVIDIFKIPKMIYSKDKGKFLLEPFKHHNLHGAAADKAALFMHRYGLIYHRTSHHEVFRQRALREKGESAYTLTKVVSLLGSNQQMKVLVLGLLTRMVEGKYHIEDDTGHIEVDISKADFHAGMIAMNTFVLVEGWFENNMLQAKAVGMPPPEPATTTRERMGLNKENYFGGSRKNSAKGMYRLVQLEQENTEAMLVVLSDVWLDVIEVMDKLRVLFTGYANFPPTAFILCGNFFSKRQESKQVGFPELMAHSKFIFVPGPTDLGPSGIFPRPPVLHYATEPLRQAVPSACFTTNPCRLVYCTQEIVVFREDLVAKMCRNCVAKTLVNQGHLAPLSLFVTPVYWTLDHCMMLHPTPDLIIIADKDNAFTTTHNGATIISPGSLFSTDFSFKVYYPATRQVEDSQIVEEEEEG
ncbi:DNA polymerase epsilon subunit 2 [Chionoecetes opilio]|uniref:DNA polymerase II subunit 2 n=1 Tax=Chionoecetes opilio TaxID=41210 RepID=A0A8J4YDW5_CHIOP|nr:DNA polymerase epsilon subunit 2 [Chionoecetes opilio]